MQIVNLYLYNDENGVVTITPTPRLAADKPERLRLIAEEGYTLTNGEIQTPARDVLIEEKSNWYEIPDEENQSFDGFNP